MKNIINAASRGRNDIYIKNRVYIENEKPVVLKNRLKITGLTGDVRIRLLGNGW